jgi:hypothetical protein
MSKSVKRILSAVLAAVLLAGMAPAAFAAEGGKPTAPKHPIESDAGQRASNYSPRQPMPPLSLAARVDEANWRFFAEGTPIVVRENGWIISAYDTGGNLLSGETDLFYYDIYGGWESGDHIGDTSVTVESGTLWSVYGGSLAGNLTGDTTVRIEGGEVDSVFGGSGGDAAPSGPDDPPATPAAITGNTSVFISGGSINSYVYGGGYSAPVSGHASVAITGGLFGEYSVVYGGGCNDSVGSASVVFDGVYWMPVAVYGGGQSGIVDGNVTVTIADSFYGGAVYGGGYSADVAGDTYVIVENSEIGSVYGGGENYAYVEGTANVSVVNSTVDTAYGGGNYYGSVGAARLTIGEDAGESGTYGFVAGGGISGMVEEDTRLEIYGGTFGRCVIAGGDDYGNETEGFVVGNTELILHGGTFNDAVYGGGWFAAVGGDTGITIEDGTFNSAVFGGGRYGTVEGETEMTIRGGTFEQPICAGGDAEIAVTGPTSMTIDDGTFLWVFGGGWIADVNGDTEITVNGGTFTTLSGGGCGLGHINGNTSVTVNGGSFGWIYGGGLGDFDTGIGGAVTGNTSVIINDCDNAGYVIGGGSETYAIVGGTANIKLKGGTVTDVFGGGWYANVTGAAVVDVWPEAVCDWVVAAAVDEPNATVGAGSRVNYWQYVSYNANGGTGSVARGEAIIGTAVAAAASTGMTPPTDKVFKEWNTDANGSGDAYAPGASVVVPENGLTLYAVWEDTPDTLVSGITVSGAGGATAISVKGASLQMEASVSPADATDKTVTWSAINGSGSAIISESGLLTAASDGAVTVRATANDGSGVFGELEITISGQRVSVTSVTIGGGAEISETGGTLNLTANVLPADADEAGVRWSVANKDSSLRTARAAIDQSGLLTAQRNGVVVVTASATDGSGASGTLEVIISGQYNTHDLTKMREFLNIAAQPLSARIAVSLFAAGDSNAVILGWDANDPASWDDRASPGVVWTELDGLFYLQSVNLTGTGVAGPLNLAGCAALEEIAVSGNTLTSMDVSNTPNLTRLYASGNQISSFSAESAPELSLIDLSGNPNAPRSAVQDALEAGCLVYTENSAKMSLIWNAEDDELVVRSTGGGHITGVAGITAEGSAYYWLFVHPEQGYEFVRFENHSGINTTSELESANTFYGIKTINGKNMTVTAVFKPINSSSGNGGGGGGSSYTNASLSVSKLTFDTYVKSADYKDISVTLNSGSYTLSAIKNGDYTLKRETDYTVSGNTVTLNATYLATLTVGAHSITFDMSGGTDPKLSLTVTDSAPVEPPPYVNPFTDVAAGAWYYDDVRFVRENGLMNGTAADRFSPELPITRGMIVTILYRHAGERNVDSLNNPFDDVAESQYYADPVKWAAESGIVEGVGTRQFAPDKRITRQDLAVILYRYAACIGAEPPTVRPPQEFTDAAEISGYAGEAVMALYRAGILNGKDGGVFDPRGAASRAESAAMLHRFIQAIGQDSAL